MAGKAKLELLMKLKNKLFNNRLMQTKRKLAGATKKMRGDLLKLRIRALKTFKAMRQCHLVKG